MSLLEIESLTMRFGGLTAVKDLSLSVEPGTIHSIIGPNGAGKTTVFNAMTGVYEPTSGSIRFAGHELSRPLTPKVWLACAITGLLTGLASLLVAVNPDALWRAAVKRNYDPRQPYALANIGRDAWGYFQGRLALERLPRNRWSVVTADGEQTLGFAPNRAEADALRGRLEEMIAMPDSSVPLRQQGESWLLDSQDGKRVLASYSSQAQAEAERAKLTKAAGARDARQRRAWIAIVVGSLLGSSGAFAVWQRSRRTPDVIAQGGIARTFQNIRLFQNMTAVENVLVAVDRTRRAGFISMALHLPQARRVEQAALGRAMDLLNFAGLADKRNELARNLPYGDQRRLEIARALAAEPGLLLLDEPAAGMNPAESNDLMGLIRKIRDRGMTVLLIEHHMKLVMGISDTITVLDHGIKIAAGSPQQVRSNPVVIEAYLGKEELG